MELVNQCPDRRALRKRRVSALYPLSFDSLPAWAREHNIAMTEARRRFAQYVMLRAIANSRALSDFLVFKGGNALDFMWQPNRSTLDLDFSTAQVVADLRNEAESLRTLFTGALNNVGPPFGVLCRVAKIEQRPPGQDKTFVTYLVRVAYALPDQGPLRRRMDTDRTYGPQLIDIEISINEPICADEPRDINGTHRLRVSTIEDIVAEKLRALLQQPIRDRARPQDLLDIAVVLRQGASLDRTHVTDFLLRKAEARHVPVSRAAFHHPEIMERAKRGYDELKGTTRVLFVPFDEARDLLYGLVDTLAILEE